MFQLLVCYDFRYVYQVKDGWYFVPKGPQDCFFFISMKSLEFPLLSKKEK
jgi:hypothetical protein